MKRELVELRTRLSKQEHLLQGTTERLRTATQQKASMEQFIFSQCGCPQARGGEDMGRGGDRTPHLCLRVDSVTTEAGGGGETGVVPPNPLCHE